MGVIAMNSKPDWIPFRSTALTDPIGPDAPRELTGRKKRNASRIFRIAAGTIPTVLTLVILFVFAQDARTDVFTSFTSGIPLFIFSIVVGLAVMIITIFRDSSRKRAISTYRLSRFAQDNAMTYIPRLVRPPLPGLIFPRVTSPVAIDIVRGSSPRVVEFGNLQHQVRDGDSTRTATIGYIAIRVDNLLPNIVLDAVGNNSLSGGLPFGLGLDRDQRLRLEGDFDKFFKLYCPQGYEADALYLFTPDIMERFITQAAVLDVEFVDNWVLFYAPGRELSTIDPAMWAWLFSLVHAMLTKISQWERWRDDRLAGVAPLSPPAAPASVEQTPAAAAGVPFHAVQDVRPPSLMRQAPGVAASGRRLRGGAPRWAIVTAVVAVLIGVGGLMVPVLIGLFAFGR